MQKKNEPFYVENYIKLWIKKQNKKNYKKKFNSGGGGFVLSLNWPEI